MGGRASRNKGCTFERLVASMIIKAAGKPFTKKDCFRTPLSGGHPYAGESDLQFTKHLRCVLPFVVECKHYKGLKPTQFFSLPNAQISTWMAQVTVAAEKDKFRRYPMLVMRGNATPIYAAAPQEAWMGWGTGLWKTLVPGLTFREYDSEDVWKIVEWWYVAKAIKIARRRWDKDR